MTTPDNIYLRIKGYVLAGKSGYAACVAVGEDPRKWSKQLSRDPDIVAAKAAGEIRDRGHRQPAWHFAEMPWVVDVLQNGMTQTAAAIKHGKPQPYISLCVKRAKGEGAEQGAPTTTASASPPQPTPETQPSPLLGSQEAELETLANILRDAAKRLNMPPETLVLDMIHRLAD